jgi:hypothetical protein
MLAHSEQWCPNCQGYRLCERVGPNHVLHLLVSLVTAGAWLLVWLGVGIACQSRPWVCRTCGNFVEMGRFDVPPLAAVVIICSFLIICLCLVGILTRPYIPPPGHLPSSHTIPHLAR